MPGILHFCFITPSGFMIQKADGNLFCKLTNSVLIFAYLLEQVNVAHGVFAAHFLAAYLIFMKC